MSLSEKEIENWKKHIDNMSQYDMCRLWRFAEVGHPIFDKQYPLFEYFEERFKGFTPEISKSLGWDGYPIKGHYNEN